MTAQSIVCGTCATAVPYGRLSCPSCGELLASVAGARRTAGATGRPALPDVLYEADTAPGATVVQGQLALESAGRDIDAELPWTTTTTAHAGGPPSADDTIDDRAGTDEPEGLAEGAEAALDDVDVSWPVHGSSWAPSATSLDGSPTPSYLPRPGLGPTHDSTYVAPGAYVPPMPLAMASAGPSVPARAWGGLAPAPDVRVDAVVAPALPVAPTTSGADAPAGPATASDDRRARFAEFVGWLSVAGAAFSAVGFLLPWGVVMIGSSGVDYFARWGLAGPAHVLVVLGLLTMLALGFVTNAVPVWIRTGLAGLGLGALLFGLVWPYLLGPLGSGPGVLMVAVGAVALAVAGILALVADRHVEADTAV